MIINYISWFSDSILLQFLVDYDILPTLWIYIVMTCKQA